MLELYIGKLEDKKDTDMHQIERDMRRKVKEFLEGELKFIEKIQPGVMFYAGSSISLWKFYKKNSGNVIELEVSYNGMSYTHKITGYGSNKVMKPLVEKVTQLYDEYELKNDSDRIKGFVKE